MAGQVVGYARVSSTSQNHDRQLSAIGMVGELFTGHVFGENREGRDGWPLHCDTCDAATRCGSRRCTGSLARRP